MVPWGAKVTVSPLSGCINLAVATVDLGDNHPGSPIRSLKGSNTPTGRRVCVIAQKPTRQNRVYPCYLSQDAFHLVDSIRQNICKKFVT